MPAVHSPARHTRIVSLVGSTLRSVAGISRSVSGPAVRRSLILAGRYRDHRRITQPLDERSPSMLEASTSHQTIQASRRRSRSSGARSSGG
jgi:hypothetical protein